MPRPRISRHIEAKIAELAILPSNSKKSGFEISLMLEEWLEERGESHLGPSLRKVQEVVSEARRHRSDGWLDEPFSLGTLAAHGVELPVDSVPVVLVTAEYAGLYGYDFSNRDAVWAGRLFRVHESVHGPIAPKIEKARVRQDMPASRNWYGGLTVALRDLFWMVSRYVRQERIAEYFNQPSSTRDLDWLEADAVLTGPVAPWPSGFRVPPRADTSSRSISPREINRIRALDMPHSAVETKTMDSLAESEIFAETVDHVLDGPEGCEFRDYVVVDPNALALIAEENEGAEEVVREAWQSADPYDPENAQRIVRVTENYMDFAEGRKMLAAMSRLIERTDWDDFSREERIHWTRRVHAAAARRSVEDAVKAVELEIAASRDSGDLPVPSNAERLGGRCDYVRHVSADGDAWIEDLNMELVHRRDRELRQLKEAKAPVGG